MWISSSKVCELTGATARQVHLWTRLKVIPARSEVKQVEKVYRDRNRKTRKGIAVGSGNVFLYDDAHLPAIRCLVRCQRQFENHLSIEILMAIFRDYPVGYTKLGEGVVIGWEREKINSTY